MQGKEKIFKQKIKNHSMIEINFQADKKILLGKSDTHLQRIFIFYQEKLQ